MTKEWRRLSSQCRDNSSTEQLQRGHITEAARDRVMDSKGTGGRAGDGRVLGDGASFCHYVRVSTTGHSMQYQDGILNEQAQMMELSAGIMQRATQSSRPSLHNTPSSPSTLQVFPGEQKLRIQSLCITLSLKLVFQFKIQQCPT